MGIETAVVSIAAQGASFMSSRKAAKSMKQRAAVEQRMQALEVQRKQREQMERARAIKARATNVAEQVGAEGSTAIASMTGAVTSSAFDNVNFLQTGLNAATEMNRLGEKAADAQGDAAVFSAVGGVADMFATATGGYGELGETLGKGVKPVVNSVKSLFS